jgi:hypothetical protein
MKKVMLLLVVMFGMMSCNNSDSVKQAKLDLLTATSRLSSLNYNVEIKRYMVKHQVNTIEFKILDSIRKVSDKRCDSILSSGVDKVYRKY